MYCPLSCKLCYATSISTTVTSTICKDSDIKICTQYAAVGYCNTYLSVQLYCPLTCKICNGTSLNTTRIATTSFSKNCSSCQNGGVCNIETGMCSCATGYTGMTCLTCKNVLRSKYHHWISEIFTNLVIACLAGGEYTCKNNGNCLNINGVGACQCSFGYTGSTCTSFLGCAAGGQFACLNGAICNSNTGACQCSTGYSGTYCGTFLGCNGGGQFTCLNGAICNTNTGSCQCSNGYTGSTCSICKGWKFFIQNFLSLVLFH